MHLHGILLQTAFLVVQIHCPPGGRLDEEHAQQKHFYYPERSEKSESGHAQVQRVSITADSLHGDDQDISECKDCRSGTEIEEEETASGPESHPLAAACDPPDNGDEGESQVLNMMMLPARAIILSPYGGTPPQRV